MLWEFKGRIAVLGVRWPVTASRAGEMAAARQAGKAGGRGKGAYLPGSHSEQRHGVYPCGLSGRGRPELGVAECAGE